MSEIKPFYQGERICFIGDSITELTNSMKDNNNGNCYTSDCI